MVLFKDICLITVIYVKLVLTRQTIIQWFSLTSNRNMKILNFRENDQSNIGKWMKFVVYFENFVLNNLKNLKYKLQ